MFNSQHPLFKAAKMSAKEMIGFEYSSMFGTKAASRGWLGLKGGRGGIFGGVLGMAYTAASAYEGYQEGGAFGAAKNIGLQLGIQTGFRYLGGALFGAAATTVGGIAAAGYAGYQIGEASIRHKRNLQRTEFVQRDLLNVIGTPGAYTMRQRAAGALSNSHINGRMALGREAQLLHY